MYGHGAIECKRTALDASKTPSHLGPRHFIVINEHKVHLLRIHYTLGGLMPYVDSFLLDARSCELAS